MKSLSILFMSLLFSCNSIEINNNVASKNFTDNFSSNLNLLWEDASQNNSPMSYQLENGYLKMTTRAQSQDRVKVKTIKAHFGLGVYKWHVYVPTFELNAQCSIGAFIYKDDLTELDFEIGSGSQVVRTQLNAQSNDMIVYCT
ncbi:MAG: hypothetical protein V3U80_08940, partial [Flavobacteriaceae bacterium]